MCRKSEFKEKLLVTMCRLWLQHFLTMILIKVPVDFRRCLVKMYYKKSTIAVIMEALRVERATVINYLNCI